ncbi:zf-HC2 domain-containing protein [Streptomyces sp. TG1A-8]|uniref:zf-HC2 domain-containing protein n=1 Tax=Streptomyces sp. TG1A-8 TaxID=3051385 RepID=UPI00265C735F|nr:zf-HC2 domain-containing protein [Streptomyces sp. TG1A-8]MDO0924589.1 zf-HC2 domain-containing protein [Streptomyces sp. TG1A-8]
MTETHRPTRNTEEKTAVAECRTVCDLLAGHALAALAPGEAAAVGAHLASCGRCRDEYDCLARVAAHLSSLRAAAPAGRGGPPSPGHRRPHRPVPLTLPQWVSRTAAAGGGPRCGDGRAREAAA